MLFSFFSGFADGKMTESGTHSKEEIAREIKQIFVYVKVRKYLLMKYVIELSKSFSLNDDC